MALLTRVRDLFNHQGYSVVNTTRIRGRRLLFTYLAVITTVWLIIILVILINHGHIASVQLHDSPTNYKMTGPIVTNFTRNDFNLDYVRPEEFSSYNRIWSPEDYTFIEDDDKMEVITDLVITANQTMRVCPDSPLISGAICGPGHSGCEQGKQMKLGVQTGRCIPGDYPYFNETMKKYTNVSVCEIYGWCPANRLQRVLKDRAVLLDTRNSKVWLKTDIDFPEYGIMFDNQPNPDLNYYIHCRYNRSVDPICPVFVMQDIIDYTDNNEEDYETIAKHGAVILFNINWQCWRPLLRQFRAVDDCQLEYNWLRTDDEGTQPHVGYRSFRESFYYNDRLKTYWLTRAIKLKFKVVTTLSWFSLWNLLIALGISYEYFEFSMYLFERYVRHRFARQLNLQTINDIDSDEEYENLELVANEQLEYRANNQDNQERNERVALQSVNRNQFHSNSIV